MKLLQTLSSLATCLALAHALPTPTTQSTTATKTNDLTRRQCWVDTDGSQHCNNTPRCTTHPDGSISCVV
ncbi:hypothetical protein L249_5228 [Ophiocordyceps polyrhachis-furcata BCC 54312]|uniref:Uncharacterized protein n=1 Tax=Ophiocordyceps polyrhachis-furcata BCC 54312 TaxID=1330021 RepID=A0A367L8Z8_9HYPO|nr:hypothetical protein L249_5228 [Ophiocordyceps polyrhachis-furcata BCC 54312]